MKKFQNLFKEMLMTINFDGLRCIMKGDPSNREIIDALRRQKEIDGGTRA